MGSPEASAGALNGPLFRPFLASAIGALLLYAAMLTAGHFDLLRWQPVGDFYDSQARSILDLRLDMPFHVLGLEGFRIHGKSYMYFGPVPALLRLPVVLVTDQLDGRLTQLSMLAAVAVTLLAIARLYRRLRPLLRGDAPVTRSEARVAAAFLLVATVGGVPLFLASRASVYHEAALWGLALSLVAYDQVLAFIATPHRRSLLLACLFTTLALLTRVSVGIGPLVALGLLLVGHLLGRSPTGGGRQSDEEESWAGRRRARWLGLHPDHCARFWLIRLGLAFCLPILLYSSINLLKFGSPFSVPFERQVITALSPNRQLVLKSNHGSIFAARFVPPTLWEYFRPDAFRFNGLFPWVTFRHPPRPTVIWGTQFESIDWASSVSTTMPALLALSVAGLMVLASRGGAGPRSNALVVPLVGAAAGAAPFLATDAIAHRYLADLFPLLVIASLTGLHALHSFSVGGLRPGAPGRWRILSAWFLLAVLAVAGAFANFALALLYQGNYSGFAPDRNRADLVRLQNLVDGASVRDRLRTGAELPPNARDQDLFVIGDCAGLYRYVDGDAWHPVERTNATGHFRFRVTFPSRDVGTREPLIGSGTAGSGNYLMVQYDSPGSVRFGYVSEFSGGASFLGAEQDVGASSHMIDLVLDRRVLEVGVWLDGKTAFGGRMAFEPLPRDRETSYVVGGSYMPGSVAPAFTGTLAALPVSNGTCRSLDPPLFQGRQTQIPR